jgi:hypothetical protein
MGEIAVKDESSMVFSPEIERIIFLVFSILFTLV